MKAGPYQHVQVPRGADKATIAADGSLEIPDNLIIPYIEGDGIGIDVTPVMRQVVDSAVQKAYAGKRKIAWMEIYAGEKARRLYGQQAWLPAESLQIMQDFLISIKGPLATPVGEGLRSLNVGIRQQMDLYACVRPIRYFAGTPTPMKASEATDMVVFRENTEDIYAGIEWPAESAEVEKVLTFLQDTMRVSAIRFPESCGIGIKPVSRQGSERLIRKAIQFAIDNNRKSVTLVHKGNIMKFTEGAFRNWGYQLAKREFAARQIGGGPWCEINSPDRQNRIIIKDVIADNFLQQILLKPELYDVIATLNLNGDYISDALAAQVGGIGIAPGANMSDSVAVFEATHGTAPKYAGKNRVNPGSIILSAEMMLRHIGWIQAADLILRGVAGAIASKTVTYDLARVRAGLSTKTSAQPANAGNIEQQLENLMPGATLVTTSGFGEAIVSCM